LAFYTSYLSKKINSPALRADTLHHHQDAISSLLVLLAFILSMYGYPYLDGPIGIFISFIILYSSYQIAKSPVDHLLGIAPEDKLLEKIENIALSNPEIQGIHDIIIHQYGEIKVISLHIEVDESLSLENSHKIAEELDRILNKKLNTYTTIHVDPVMKRTQLYNQIESTVKSFCNKSAECASFHDLRIFRENNMIKISVDLVTDSKFSNPSVKKLRRDCYLYLKEMIPDISHVSIKIEPKFSVSRKSRHN
jgi:divalent metal cation (Fe/Co/Zn/Cd) transporter